jgi:hypothetical protein
MCDLTIRIPEKSRQGFKIVLEREDNKKNYSAAMGFCYDDLPGGKVPIVKEQDNIGEYYVNCILISNNLYKPNMVGRSSIILNIVDALTEIQDLFRWGENIATKFNSSEKLKPFIYKLKLKKAIVSNGLMLGSYRLSVGSYLLSGGSDIPVVAGRNIQILNEVAWEETKNGTDEERE